ncbi:MAG: response regulator [Lachnospiraceae bacterium]|nr:response regulator [Lachnospiraceae bacterium]
MKKTILVVDDDKSNLMMAQKVLVDEYRVAAVNSGKLAFQYLEKNDPVMILLDIQMPEMDGFEVMKILQANAKWCKIPVIFLTADRTPQTEEACFQMGAVDYIGKPFIPAIMQQRVRRTIELEDYRRSLEVMVQQQLEKITQLQQDIIITMANLIEGRDGTTGEHVKHTSIYTEYLIKKMAEKGIYEEQLTPDFVNYLKKAAPMHDIGKITVPDSILRKPGALTEEEYAVMKLHAEEGARLIKENMSRLAEPEFVKIASNMANFHHESWNGKGYPSGLLGEEIPLEARILAVADVFDALVAKRQYKQGMSMEEAREIMMRDRGERYEAMLLDAFFSDEKELKELMKDLGADSKSF